MAAATAATAATAAAALPGYTNCKRQRVHLHQRAVLEQYLSSDGLTSANTSLVIKSRPNGKGCTAENIERTKSRSNRGSPQLNNKPLKEETYIETLVTTWASLDTVLSF